MMTRWLALFLAVAPTLAVAENRYPQPVRAGDLVGHKLISPLEAQPLLGRVAAVEKAPNGSLALRVELGGCQPWSHRSVRVPLADVAWLGPELALLDLTPAQLDALPDAPAGTPVPPDETIRIGLTRPFH